MKEQGDELIQLLRNLFTEFPHPALLEAADRLEKYESEAPPSKREQDKWHCNKCGHDFLEEDAESVDHFSQECDECFVACPKCLASYADEDDILTPPND